MSDFKIYDEFQARADKLKNNFLAFLIDEKNKGKKVVAYGAAAKGCTLLNYAGVKPDLLPYVCDAAPSKQGKYLPGTHVPIEHPSRINADQPDIVIIFPWNIQTEVMRQMAHIRDWGGQFAVAVPSMKLL